MSSTNEGWECSICTEVLLDPRVLPCGHSFCSPPRRCLQSLLLEPEKVFKCALCNKTHKVNLSDLIPLYGIRDALQSMSTSMTQASKAEASSKKRSEKFPTCSTHPLNDLTMWCSDCAVAVCSICLDQNHEEHSMKSYKSILRKQALKIQDKFEQIRKSEVVSESNLSKLQSELGKHKKIANDLTLKLTKLKELKAFQANYDQNSAEFSSFCAGEDSNFDLRNVDIFSKCLRISQDELSSLKNNPDAENKDSLKFGALFHTIRNLKANKEFCSGSLVTGDLRFWVSCLRCDVGEGESLFLFLHCEPIDLNKLSHGWSANVRYKLTLVNWRFTEQSIWIENTKKFSHKETCYGESVIKWKSLLDQDKNWLSGNDRIFVECEFYEIDAN